jgi:hypothetical protein
MAVPGGLPAAQARLTDLRIALAMKRIVDARGGTASAMANPSAAMLNNAGLQFTAREKRAVRNGAHDVLRMSPLSSPALRQLALIEPDPVKRERLLSLAHSTSRRDVTAALQLAEMNLRRGNAPPALAALNRALIVSSALDETVFPLFAGAATDPTAAQQLGSLLSKDPLWAERFIRWALANPASLGPMSVLVDDIPKSSVARQIGFGQQMVDLLTTQRRYGEAFAVQRAYSDKPPAISNLTSGAFQPLDWQLIDNYDAGSRAIGPNVLEVFANPGRQGDVAQVITRLEPGSHRLVLRLDDTVGNGAQLRFGVACVALRTERSIAERAVPLADGAAAFGFVVPASACEFQRIVLRIAADAESVGALIRSASLGKGAAAAPESE